MLWAPNVVARICVGLEEMYRSRNMHKTSWFRIEAAGKSSREIAAICLPVIFKEYERWRARLASGQGRSEPQKVKTAEMD